jgi:hypothetical protein
MEEILLLSSLTCRGKLQRGVDLCRENQRKRNVSEARMQRARNQARGPGRNRGDRGGSWRGTEHQGGRNRGRHDRQGGRGSTMINRVDISDPHRTFTAIEFQNLGASGR